MILFIKISLDVPSVLWEAWWALVMKKLQLFRAQVSNSHWSVKLHFFPSLWIHTDIIYFLVFIWKWKSCRDSLVAEVGSWEVGNDIQPVCSSGKCFHSNPGNCYLPLWKTLPHLHICKKTNPFPPTSAFLANLFCLCQSRVNWKEGFWVYEKPFSLLGQSRHGIGAQKNGVLSIHGVFQVVTG